MQDPRIRADLSRFLVHLTRDYEGDAEDNLLSMLEDQLIEARNAHCLFSPLIKNSKFSSVLKTKFNSVCFTEAPLPQVSSLLIDVPGRSVKLKPYGLVFWRNDLVSRGANPAVYINAAGSNSLRQYLLDQFKGHFQNIRTFRKFQSRQAYFNELIHYYALVNVISTNHDFAWEREWRFVGDFRFKYKDIVAVIAEDPDSLIERCKDELGPRAVNCINRTPIISPHWDYEQVLEQLSIMLWRVK